MLVDSHCHLDFPELAGDLTDVLANMARNGVAKALCISVRLEQFDRLRSLVGERANLYASVGVHPDEADAEEPTVKRLLALADDPKVVAIGETGLDYFRLTGDLTWQRDRFRTHIRAARESGKPLIVHTRAAADDTIDILREEGAAEVGGVMHCFTESRAIAQAAMAMGFYISFSGIVTFKNAAELREVARDIPLDRMLIETDAPYLAPVPHRGKRNEPAFVRHVAECLAELRGSSLDAIAAATTENFHRLFGIPAR